MLLIIHDKLTSSDESSDLDFGLCMQESCFRREKSIYDPFSNLSTFEWRVVTPELLFQTKDVI